MEKDVREINLRIFARPIRSSSISTCDFTSHPSRHHRAVDSPMSIGKGVSNRWTGFSTGTWDWNVGLDCLTGTWDWTAGLECGTGIMSTEIRL